MKSRIILIFAIASLFVLPSCEDNPLDITEEFYYEKEIQVFTTDTAMMVTEVIDMAAQSDLISQYADKIQTVEITEVKYWLTAFEGEDDQTIVESSLKVADGSGAGEQLIAEIMNQNLKQLLDTPKELAVQQAGVDKMADLIKNDPHTFQLTYNTSCNKGPLNFKIKFQFKIKMVANPLN